MYINGVLDETEQDKLFLLELIEADGNKHIPIDSILSVWPVSKFKFQKIINGLNNDFKNHIPTQKVCISIVNVYFIESENIIKDTIAILKVVYLEKSLRFLFLKNMLQSKINYIEFSKDNFISESKAYFIQKDLNTLMQSKNIAIKNGELLGEENAIRMFFFDIYYSFYNGVSDPFDDMKIVGFVAGVRKAFKVQLTITQEIKLKFFLAISYYQMKKGNHIFVDKIEVNSSELNSYEILTAYQSFFSLAGNMIANESNYLVSFAFSENIIAITDQLYFTREGSEPLKRETDKYIHTFKEKIIFDDGVEIDKIDNALSVLYCEIYRINFKRKYFDFTPSSFTSEAQLIYFLEVYPEYYWMINKYLQKNHSDFARKERATLFYDYLFATISTIPNHYLSWRLNICIDFSRGKNYTDYIANNVLLFQSLNITIETRTSSNTDLYISDIKINSLSCQQIIWEQPPTNRDWKGLGDKLVEIRKVKFNG